MDLVGIRDGTRMPRMYREIIGEQEIMTELDSLFGQWAKDREAGEALGDYVVRAGVVNPVVDSARDFYDE